MYAVSETLTKVSEVFTDAKSIVAEMDNGERILIEADTLFCREFNLQFRLSADTAYLEYKEKIIHDGYENKEMRIQRLEGNYRCVTK